jgi:hypothetical protein
MPALDRAKSSKLSTFHVDNVCMTSVLQFAASEFIVWSLVAELPSAASA